MAEGADLDLPTEEEIDKMKFGKLSRLLQKLGMTEDETDDMDKEEAREELRKRIRHPETQSTAAARKPAEQVGNKQQKSEPLHADVDMAEVADLPTEEEVDKMEILQLYLPLRIVGLTDAEVGKLSEKDAKAELKKRIRDIQAAAATRRRAGQAAENLTEVLNKHNSKRERLAELCHRIAAYLPKLNDSIKDQLKIEFDRDAKDILQDVQGHLEKEECCLLVAGEASSGKSTFLNVLLGESILAVANMSGTSAICELKYGETKQAVVHLRQPNDQGQGQITIPLDGTEEHQAELKSYMHLRGASRVSLPPAEKIEVFWPLRLLKGGIVIVDSPGVGESKMMDKVVAEYIPKCFAFLYIIDSSRAGGVQQDRLGKFLKLYAEKGNAEDFDPESAMFICNKWDQVPTYEQDAVKSYTFSKLSEMWPGLKEEQVFYVSTSKAVGPGGILSEDFTKVLDGLDSLLPKSLDIKLETQYRLLSELLSACLSHINVLLNFAMQNIDNETKWKRYDKVKEHLQSFDDQETLGLTELEKVVERNMENMKSVLYVLIENGTLRKDLLAVQELPVLVSWLIPSHRRVKHQDVLVKLVHDKRGEDFSKLKALYEALANTLAQCPGFKWIVSEWRKIRGLSFNDKLKEVAKSLEKGQQQTMTIITGSSSSVPHMEVTRDALLQTPFLDTIYDRFVRGLTISSFHWPERWIVAYLLNWEAHSSTVSILQKCWDHARASTPLVDILMQALKSDELLTELAERQVQPQRDLMSKMKVDSKKMKDSMGKAIDMLEETFEDTSSNDDILQTYEPQIEKINSFLGQLAMFHLTEMRKYEFDLDSIPGWRDGRNRLGGGSFGEVYRVQVQWKGTEIPVALKIGVYPYDIITTETAWDFLKEEDNLRKLQGEYIVEYFGTACKRVKTRGEPDSLRLGLVMELCDGTLEDRVIAKRDHNPARWADDPEKQAAAFSYTQNLAVQLCKGLRMTHDAEYVHRDLKLSNILVTKGNTVKLADVGQAKQEVKITGTKAGTPLYAAPEVKEGQMYDKSADIYSLGLILWEMWYGVPLYEDPAYAKEMEKDLKEGKDIRMPNWNGTIPPTPEWASLINDCLKKDPRERPKIRECLHRILNFHN